MTIMLVDSDRNQHELFQEVVRRIDSAHKCLKAFSTESALDFLLEEDSNLPDIIFMDLQFRSGGGKEMMEALKSSVILQGIPVCIYTNSQSDDDREATRQMGAIGYIVKDPNITNMVAAIGIIIAEVTGSTIPG